MGLSCNPVRVQPRRAHLGGSLKARISHASCRVMGGYSTRGAERNQALPP